MPEAKKQRNKYLKYSLLSLLGLIIIFVLLVVSAYVLGEKSSFARRTAKAFSLPAAWVGSNTVPLQDYYERSQILDRVLGNIRDVEINGDPKSSILDKMIENEVAGEIAKREKVSVDQSDVDEIYNYRKQVTGQNDLASRYGLSESEFKKIFSEPEALNTKLAIALASDVNLNSKAHKKLQEAKNKISQGQAFEDAAKQYSDDETSARIGGDVGFLTVRDITPEYFKAISQVKDKNLHFVATRYGLYLFEVLDKDNNGPNKIDRYHVKQIFFQTIDYSKWLNDEVNKHKIIKLV